MKNQTTSNTQTDIRNSIDAIKAKLEMVQDKSRTIPDLIKEEIDRPFPLILEEFSDTELDVEMAKRASRINEALNLKQRINQKTGNKLIKLLLAIPYLIHFLFTKPIHIIKDFSVFNHILFLRLRRVDRQIEQLRGRMAELKGNDLEAACDEPETET